LVALVTLPAGTDEAGGPPPQVLRATGQPHPLRQISPVEYVQRLTGRTVSRTGWVACPFHQDTRPSLRVYETPEQGWCCYSAECSGTDGRPRGGSIYDLAAPLFGYDLRGPEFKQLKGVLAEMFQLQAT